MNLKMKFLGLALSFGVASANAQSVDFDQERKANPERGKALACVAIGSAINVDLGKSHARYDEIRGMLHTAVKKALDGYSSENINVVGEKFVPATLQALQELQHDKVKDDKAYQRKKAEYFRALDDCLKAYPDTIGRQPK